MSAPPYMKLFWGDYHKATRHLTRDQHGAYFLLLGEAWRLGGVLPSDDSLLAAWALCTPAEWSAIKPTVMAFFTLRRGKWTHDRVRHELASYETISRQRKLAGKRGGKASGGKDEGNSQAIANQLPTKPEPEPEPEPEPLEEVSLAKANSCKSVPPGFDRFWSAYPRKVGKGAAEKSWIKAIRSIGGDDAQAILIRALERDKEIWSDPQFTPHAATWLNQRRWEDEPEAINVVRIRPGLAKSYSEQAAETWAEASKRLEEKWQAEQTS